MSVLSMCRLCLYNTSEYLDFSVDGPDKLQEKIEKFLYIQITDEDPFPRTICHNCVNRLQQFHDFYVEVAQNQQILHFSQPNLNDTGDTQTITITNDLTKTTKTASLIQLPHGFNLKSDMNFVLTLQTTPSTTVNAVDLGNGTPTTIDLHHFIRTDEALCTTNLQNLNIISSNQSSEIDPKSISIVAQNSSVQTEEIHTSYLDAITTYSSDNELTVTFDEATSDLVHCVSNGNEKFFIDTNNEQDANHKRKRKSKVKTKLIEVIEIDKADKRHLQINKSTTSLENNEKSLKLECELDNLHSDDVVMANDLDSDADEEENGNDIEIALDKIGMDNERFKGFPKYIINDAKLVIRGKQLVELMSKFYRLECDLCPTFKNRLQFENLGELYHHYVSEHSMKGYVICCGIKLIKPRAMALHMARHLQPDAFKCSQCDKMLTCPKILQYHMQNHLPEEQRPLPCSLCPRRFSYSSALVAHAITHQPEHERAAHVCDECGKSFASAGRLVTHVNVAHMLHGQDFICHICAKQFACRSNLSYHLTTHQPKVRKVQCEKCGKWLKNKLCLRKHMVQHSTIRYSCNKCNYSALNRQCLRNHIRVQHSDVKPFGCDVCSKTFKLKNTLSNHMVQHTGIRKFSCPFCARTFASSGNYYTHRKRMHPQELAAMKLKEEEEERILREQTLSESIKSEKS